MAKRKLKKNKNGFTVLGLNYEVLNKKFSEKRKIVASKNAMAKETSMSLVTLKLWESELPQAVLVLNYLMEEFDMSFEEITKKMYE
jgi:hypothetical protein